MKTKIILLGILAFAVQSIAQTERESIGLGASGGPSTPYVPRPTIHVTGREWPQHEFHFVTLAPVSEISALDKVPDRMDWFEQGELDKTFIRSSPTSASHAISIHQLGWSIRHRVSLRDLSHSHSFQAAIRQLYLCQTIRGWQLDSHLHCSNTGFASAP
jgi:hypothetical protein